MLLVPIDEVSDAEVPECHVPLALGDQVPEDEFLPVDFDFLQMNEMNDDILAFINVTEDITYSKEDERG